VAAVVADMYTHTEVVLVILDKDTKAELVFGKALAKLVAAVAADLLAPDNKVTEMQAEQAATVLPYWDLA
jgi:hypothetical protein